jgi:hypothetical protein
MGDVLADSRNIFGAAAGILGGLVALRTPQNEDEWRDLMYEAAGRARDLLPIVDEVVTGKRPK